MQLRLQPENLQKGGIRMVGVTVTGKFKDPEKLKWATKAGKMMASLIKTLDPDLIKGCKKYFLFTKPDGSFTEVSTWESKEDVDRLLDHDAIMKTSETLSDMLGGTYDIEVYEHAQEIEEVEKVTA